VNCRRVSNLLSAYLDAELTGAEMLEIRAHLDRCPACQAEHQALRQTKHLLSSLALRAPRAEFESLLLSQAQHMSHPLARWVPSWLMAWRDGAVSWPRPRPLAATAVLSLAGLFLATASLDTPASAPVRVAVPDVHQSFVRPPYMEQHLLPAPYTAPVDTTPLTWSGDRNAPILSVFHPGYPNR